MVLSVVANKAEAQRAMRALKTTQDVVLPGMPYAYHYFIQALIDCGMNNEAKDALVEY